MPADRCSVIFILVIVARSKLVLDFALTTLFVHLVATTLYTRVLPATLFWWALQALVAGTMTGLGVWTCRWRELRPISFGAPAGDVENGEVGFLQGRSGAGMGADGVGVYEMVDRTEGSVLSIV